MRAFRFACAVAAVVVGTAVVTAVHGPLATAAPRTAAAAPPNLAKIALVSSATAGGWKYDFYRNSAYPCSLSGYQTFTIATRTGVPAASTQPLWTYLHGGGSGYFDPAGNPQPDTAQMTEEPAARQQQSLENVELTKRLRAASATGRLLAVSMCNRDIYGGVGNPDPNNPNRTPDGKQVTTNGLVHTLAAVEFTTGRYPTNDNFLYGTSAGSYGTFHVAYALQQLGLKPAGTVSDSGIMNTLWQQAVKDRPGCGHDGAWEEIFPRRLDPSITSGTNDPDQLITSGRLTVPVMQVWTVNDPGQCGTQPMSCPLRDGTTPTMGSVDCVHEPMRLALQA